jgi:hypothetical protein
MRHWGILAPAFKGFIDMKELTYEFVLYLLANICRGSNAGEVEILGTTFMQLQAGRPDRFCRSPRPCTGIMPGTDAGYGNEVGNYSYRAYAIEELDNPAVQETMRALAARAPQEIGEVVEVLPVDDDAAIQANFTAQIARVAGKSVAYQAASGQWTTWDFPAESQPVSQFAVTYSGPDASGGYEDKAWATYKLNGQGLQHDKTYVVYDLVSGLQLSKSGWELEQEGIRIGLNAATKDSPARNRHHFVIYEL